MECRRNHRRECDCCRACAIRIYDEEEPADEEAPEQYEPDDSDLGARAAAHTIHTTIK